MRIFLIVFLFNLSCPLLGQLNGKYTFRHIDQSDGLLHSTVIGIEQDKKGFMWILTQGGLQRFDGIRFVTFLETDNPVSGLIGDTLLNQISVITNQTMHRLDLNTNKFHTYSVSDVIREDTINSKAFYTTKTGDTLLITPEGVILYEKNSKKILSSTFNDHPGTTHQSTYIFYDKSAGNYYTHHYNQLIIANTKTNNVMASNDEDPGDPLLKVLKKMHPKDYDSRYSFIDHDQNLWITRWDDSLYRYHIPTREFFSYSLKNVVNRQGGEEKAERTILVNEIYEDRQTNLWFATENAGLLRYNRAKDDFDFITSEEKLNNGIRYNFEIRTIFQDRDDNIWVGTDRGLSIFNPYRNYFQLIRHIEGNKASLPKQGISDIIQTNNGELLIATWGGGISVYDDQWNFVRNIKFPVSEWQDLVWCFEQNDNGTIWAGTQAGFIHIYDPTSGQFNTISPPETGSTIRQMVRDHQGNILLGLHNGKITVWNKQENRFYAYNDTDDNLHPVLKAVLSLYVDQAGRCWAGTDLGLLEFDINKRVYKSVSYFKDSLTYYFLQSIEQYNDSLLLIGSVYSGAYFFNMHTHQFSRAFKDDQLNKFSISAFKKDKAGNIWLTTNYDIIKFNPDFSTKTQFYLGKNTITSSFVYNHFYEMKDGRWVTSTSSEIICFNPGILDTDRGPNFKVEISGFKIAGKTIHIDSILAQKQPVILPFNQNFISIEFTSFDFSNILETNYSYRLNGIEKDWNSSTTKQFADYTDLKPGKYVFEVKANSGGVDSPVTSLPLIITPPWWATLGFRTLSLLVIALAIYSFLKHRIRTIRKESSLKHRIAETEMMALRAQMNPHFIFNCLNSIDNLIQTDQKDKATTYLAKFARLIRAILENSKNNVIPCWKDLEALKLYLDMEALRWDNKINYQLQIDAQIQHGDYKVPPMIIQPFVENAIHHGLLNKKGADKKLDITVSLEGGDIKYTIIDNGVGRLKAAEYKQVNKTSQLAYGIQITKDRVDLFNQRHHQSVHITDLYDIRREAAGTKVEIWLNTQSEST
jgi:ligand-binding sensor domain-containing protein